MSAGDGYHLWSERYDRELIDVFVPASRFAWIYTGLGEIEQAVEWLEKAVEAKDGFVIHLHVDPCWDMLRAHPRYPALLRRMNLEP